MITPAIARAMSSQLDRVNRADDPLVERLRAELADARAEIARLHDRLAALDDAGISATGPIIVNGRPALTVAQVARTTGISIATICRYCVSGHWQATQPIGSNRWYIYADQPLTRKGRESKRGSDRFSRPKPR